MPHLNIARLTDLERPLLNKFYRQHGSPMRASGEGQLWVARRDELLAGMSLTAVAQGHWLTGLFVAPQHRGQGLAQRLVAQALGPIEGPVWLFCHPDLQALYQRMGFSSWPCLPQALADRLAGYSRSKSLVAMGIEPLVRSTKDIG